MTTILVVDDDRSVRHLVSRGLDGEYGFRVITAANGEEALEKIDAEKPSVLLLDIYLPEFNGLELFRKIKAIDNKLPVIFITGDTSSETAIEAMRAGAFDYLAKPLNIDQLRRLTLSAAKARKLMDEPVALHIGDEDSGGERFVGSSKAMIEVYKDIGRVAAQNVTVLVRGESGSGKELVARALVNHSDRRDKPFVAVNCAAIPDQLLESELFGHEKGAFTGAERRRIGRFEQCDGGTIFLDEIGDMSPIIQGKVLRLLQEQKFERLGGSRLLETHVRIIAATNRPLEQMVEAGEFREDLLYRLNGFTVQLPPLRERASDIPQLLEYFLRRAKSEMGRDELSGLAPEALELLIDYDWPGNIRQLQSVVRQSLLSTTGTVIGSDNLPDFIRRPISRPSQGNVSLKLPIEKPESKQHLGTASNSLHESQQGVGVESEIESESEQAEASPSDAAAFSLIEFIESRLSAETCNLYSETVEQVERILFARVLEETGGNQSRTAEILGITRGKVRDRVAAFNIQVDRTISVGKS